MSRLPRDAKGAGSIRNREAIGRALDRSEKSRSRIRGIDALAGHAPRLADTLGRERDLADQLDGVDVPSGDR
jgi:hypothetical protein